LIGSASLLISSTQDSVAVIINLPRWQVAESGLERKLGIYGKCPHRLAGTRQLKHLLVNSNFRRFYQRLSRRLCSELGITRDLLRHHRLPHHSETPYLERVDPSAARTIFLHPRVCAATRLLCASALKDGLSLEIISGYRSYSRQAELIKAKLQTGLKIAQVLAISAAPGHSEHHSGRAIDFNQTGESPLIEDFARTESFTWLCTNAEQFGFVLSYPENNANNIAFEPWHWLFTGNKN